MRRLLIVVIILAVLVVPAAAQDGRINNSVVDIAIYCANGGIDVWHIGDDGRGQQALTASRTQLNNGLGAARDSGGAVTVARGSFGVALTALPGLQLRVTQDFEERDYTYTFQGDTCGPLELPPEGTISPDALNPGVLVDENANPVDQPAAVTDDSGTTAQTGSIVYTVQRGDTLNRIAQRFNITLGDLLAANSIPNPNRIYPGQQVIIPNQTVEPPAPTATVAPANDGSTPTETPPPPPPPANTGGNLLRDPSFEGQYTNRGRADFNIPAEWGAQVVSSPRTYEWQNLVPTAFPHRAWVIRDGSTSLNLNKGYATFTVVLSQQVSVPANATLEGSVWAWYHTCDPGSQNCDNRSNPVVRVGIDPTGGTNPFAPGVVWSGNASPQGSWGLVGTQAEAQGGVVTMFIYASQDTPRAINELYFDEATLRQVGG